MCKNMSINNEATELFSQICHLAFDISFVESMYYRLKADCLYYLGYGNKSTKYLYASTPEIHLEVMQMLAEFVNRYYGKEKIDLNEVKKFKSKMIVG